MKEVYSSTIGRRNRSNNKYYNRNVHIIDKKIDVEQLNSIKLLKGGEGKYFNCVFLARLLNKISFFKSIAIFVPCVIICSFYQCTVDCPCWSANILRTLKHCLFYPWIIYILLLKIRYIIKYLSCNNQPVAHKRWNFDEDEDWT